MTTPIRAATRFADIGIRCANIFATTPSLQPGLSWEFMAPA